MDVIHVLRAFCYIYWAAGRPDRRAAGLTSTCGRTTWRSRGSRRTAFQQDVHSLARRDRGLPLRSESRDASAGLAQSDGSASPTATVTARLRRRATPTRRASRSSSRDSAATPPPPTMLATIRARWASTRSAAGATFASAQGGGRLATYARVGRRDNPPVSQYVYRLGRGTGVGPAAGDRESGTTPAPPPQTPSAGSAGLFLSPTLVQTLATGIGCQKILRAHHARRCDGSRQTGRPSLIARRHPRQGTERLDVPGVLWPSVSARAGRGRPPQHTRRRRPACSDAPRVQRRIAWGPLWTSKDGISGSPPRLLWAKTSTSQNTYDPAKNQCQLQPNGIPKRIPKANKKEQGNLVN